MNRVTAELREGFTQVMCKCEDHNFEIISDIVNVMVQRPYMSMKERLHQELGERTNESW